MATECSSWRFDPEKLKSYSGGDFIPHQPKFQSEKTGAVRATMILAGNAVPELGLHDPAVVSRTRVIPYPRSLSEIQCSKR